MVRAAGGFFDVMDYSGRIIRCFGRGQLKNKKTTILAGDLAEYSLDEAGQGVITGILPRKTELKRPPVANPDQLVVVAAVAEPEPDFTLISRQLILATANNLHSIICLNKTDLVDQGKISETGAMLKEFPYQVIYTSTLHRKGIGELKEALRGRITALAGPSGVGKSSLINALQPGMEQVTGEVSERNKSGRHTTRQVELLVLDNNGLVFDTPGFSRIEPGASEKNHLRLDDCFPEIRAQRGNCRFRNCMHRNEPDCAVMAAVERSSISDLRYKHYLTLLKEWQ